MSPGAIRKPVDPSTNVTLLSHYGTCCIGINTDSLAIPDAAEFAQSVEAGFSEVLALGA